MNILPTAITPYFKIYSSSPANNFKDNCKHSYLKELQADTFVSFGKREKTPVTKPIQSAIGKFEKPIMVVFSDIDGTISNSEHKISDSDLKAIKECTLNGLPIILSTGRRYAHSKTLYDKLGAKSGYFITEQGAVITDANGKIIKKYAISSKDSEQIVEAYKKYKESKPDIPTTMLVFKNGDIFTEKGSQTEDSWGPVKIIDSFDTLFEDNEMPTKFIFYQFKDEDNDNLTAFLRKNLSTNLQISQTANKHCEITSPEATKGNAVKAILELMGVEPCNAAVIGDAENDIPMIKFIKENGGLSIAMGNGFDSVKDLAEYKTKSINDGGFALAMSVIMENNRKIYASIT